MGEENSVLHLAELGKSYLESENYEEAIKVLEQATQLEPTNADYWNGLGVSYLYTNKFDKAIKAFEQSTKFEPINPVYWNNLGRAYCELKNYDKAIEAFKQATKFEPKNAEFWNNLGGACYFAKEFEKAIEAYKKATDEDKQNAHYWYNLGSAYIRLNNNPEAIKALKQATSLEPQNSEYWNNLGITYFIFDNNPEAIKALEQATKLEPTNADYWNGLGVSYLYTNKFDKAVKAFEQATQLEPKNAEYWNDLGRAYLELKNYKEAIKAYQQATQIEPKNSDYRGMLGISFLFENKLDEAIKVCKYGNTLSSYSIYYITFLEFLLAKTIDDNKKFQDIINSSENILRRNSELYFVYKIFKYFTDFNIQKSLITLNFYVRNIMNSLDCLPKNKELLHYTGVNNLQYLLKREKEDIKEKVKLQLNNASYMNDPSEGTVLIDYLKKQYSNNALLSEICEKYNKDSEDLLLSNNIYLFSFSTAIDKLNMWYQYGNKGNGCCFAFEASFFDHSNNVFSHNVMKPILEDENNKKKTEQKIKETYIPYKVQYINEKNQINNKLKPYFYKINEIICTLNDLCKSKKTREKVTQCVCECLDQIRFLFKSEAYKLEEEYRLIKYMPSDSEKINEKEANEEFPTPRLYIEKDDGKPLKYTEIYLGPKVEFNKVIPYIQYANKDIKIIKSKVKFR